MVEQWLAALEQRHLADLTVSEVGRALKALSSTYVERRERLARKSAFDSAGKRSAYALYYSPLHFLTVSHIVDALHLSDRRVHHLLDIGCGAGAAGAAWAARAAHPPQITGIDSHPWPLAEAAFTYKSFGLRGDTRRGDIGRLQIPRDVDAVVAGWVLNELSDSARTAVLDQLLAAASRGVLVLIIEPIATRVSPWWADVARSVERSGGRADEWRFRVQLPALLKQFDRAAGLRHDELKARTLLLERAAHGKGGLDGRHEG
jgi:SAM-dependent methyltransferase